MHTTQVYRVEHPQTKQGPYTSGAELFAEHRLRAEYHDMCSAHGRDTHPSWEEIGLAGYIHTQYKAGFASYKQLGAWFQGMYFNVLMTVGFRILRYDARHVVHDETDQQVVFYSEEVPVDVTDEFRAMLKGGWRHWRA